MHYKTIIHELLLEQTELHEELRRRRRVLAAIEDCARELKASHERWTEALSQANRSGDRSQITSQALEMAVQELTQRLQSVSPGDEPETLSLDAAMAHISKPTPQG